MKALISLALTFLAACCFGCGSVKPSRTGAGMSQYQIKNDLDYINQELGEIGQDSLRDSERAYLQGV